MLLQKIKMTEKYLQVFFVKPLVYSKSIESWCADQVGLVSSVLIISITNMSEKEALSVCSYPYFTRWGQSIFKFHCFRHAVFPFLSRAIIPINYSSQKLEKKNVPLLTPSIFKMLIVRPCHSNYTLYCTVTVNNFISDYSHFSILEPAKGLKSHTRRFC